MTLPSSGAITSNDVNIELGRSSGASINLNDPDVRALAAIPTGQIAMSNLHGKSLIVGSLRATLTVTIGTYITLKGFGNDMYASFGAISPASYRGATIRYVASPDQNYGREIVFEIVGNYPSSYASTMKFLTDGIVLQRLNFEYSSFYNVSRYYFGYDGSLNWEAAMNGAQKIIEVYGE